jgi:hypothetical protein
VEEVVINLKLSVKSGGKEVSMSEFTDNLAERALEMTKQHIREKIEDVRCPIHNKTGRAVLEQGPGNNFTYKVEGCCDALAEAVKESIRID